MNCFREILCCAFCILLFASGCTPKQPTATPVAPTPAPVTAADLLADALMHYEAGDYEEAIIAYLGVIEIEPKNFDAQLGLAQAYFSIQDGEAAMDAFAKAIEIDRNRPESYIGLSDIYLAQGDRSGALSVLQEGMEYADAEVLREKIAQENLVEMKVLKESNYKADGLWAFYLFEYGEDGLLAKSKRYSLVHLWDYDEVDEGWSLSRTLSHSDGILETETIYEYNEQKQKVAEIEFRCDENGDYLYGEQTTYQYNGDDLIEEKYRAYSIIYEYEDMPDGGRKAVGSIDPYSGSVIYVYDSAGNLTLEEHYDDGQLLTVYSYLYDEHGHLTKLSREERVMKSSSTMNMAACKGRTILLPMVGNGAMIYMNTGSRIRSQRRTLDENRRF